MPPDATKSIGRMKPMCGISRATSHADESPLRKSSAQSWNRFLIPTDKAGGRLANSRIYCSLMQSPVASAAASVFRMGSDHEFAVG